MKIGSLFAGIGGFDLAAEWVWGKGSTVWHSEIDPYACAVFAQHFPQSRNVGDITTWEPNVERDTVDLICGGFPCQDISYAGEGAGIDGQRSGLWREYVRIIRLLRPRLVVVENVPALLTRGLGRVLGDLAASGYDAEWDCIPAAAVGAPHRRDRIWIVAYPQSQSHRRSSHHGNGRQYLKSSRESGGSGVPALGHAYIAGPQRHRGLLQRSRQRPAWADGEIQRGQDGIERLCKPGLPLVVDGVPNGVERIKSSGNAIVPQVAEWIFRQIQAHEESLVPVPQTNS